MNEFERGDIVRQKVGETNRYDYFHIEYVHRNGALDCIADADGKRCGLSANAGRVEKATLAQLVQHREAA